MSDNSNIIIFEGIDGSGKTSLSKFLHCYLNDKSQKSVLIKEPGGIDYFANDIRNLFLNYDIDVIPQILLLFANRYQNIQNLQYFIDNNYYIIIDRFIASTYCYQLDLTDINYKHFQLIKFLEDLIIDNNIKNMKTIYLDIEIDNAVERLEGRDKFKNKFSEKTEKMDNLLTIKNNYDMYFQNKKDVITLNANYNLEDVQNELLQQLLL